MIPTTAVLVVLGSILALGQPLPLEWWDKLSQTPQYVERGGSAVETAGEGWARERGRLETELSKLQSQILNGVARTGAMAEHFNAELTGIKEWEGEAGRNVSAMMEALQALGERLARAEDGVREVNLLRHAFLDTRRQQNLLMQHLKQELESAMQSLEATHGQEVDQLTDLKTQVDAQVDVIRQQHQALEELDRLRENIAQVQEELRALKPEKPEMEAS